MTGNGVPSDGGLDIEGLLRDMDANVPPDELAAKYGVHPINTETPEGLLDLGGQLAEALAKSVFGDTARAQDAAAFVKTRLRERLKGDGGLDSENRAFIRGLKHVTAKLEQDGHVCNCAFLVGLRLVDSFAERGGFESGGEAINMYMARQASADIDPSLAARLFDWLADDGTKEGIMKIPNLVGEDDNEDVYTDEVEGDAGTPERTGPTDGSGE